MAIELKAVVFVVVAKISLNFVVDVVIPRRTAERVEQSAASTLVAVILFNEIVCPCRLAFPCRRRRPPLTSLTFLRSDAPNTTNRDRA